MRIQDYESKMLQLLNDSTYKVIQNDPTTSLQKKTNHMAKRLHDLKLIDHRTFRTLQTYTSTCPRIYGQPKAHKPDLPLRPVVPNITAPTYNLSKYIATILQDNFCSQYNIRDSFSFAEYISTISIPPDHVLVSFDVVSLFTNIPKELVIRSILHRWPDISRGTRINLDLFLEMVELCINNSYFCFRGKFYQQTFGTAMGSPLSPILADYVMEDLLESVTKKLKFNVRVLKKYVDDLFLVLPKPEVQNTLEAFNQYDNHLQFTIEMEKDGTLPFLDSLVVRHNDQSVTTKWYSKPISSGRLLNYHSFHPTTMKINVAMNFIKRVLQLTTDGQIEQQKNQIFQNLRRNDYPSSLINRMLNRITSNNAPPPPTSQRPPPPPLSPGPPPPALPQSTPTSTQLLPSLPSSPPPPLQTSPSMSPPMQLQPSITNPPTEQHQTNSPQRDHQHQATEVLYRSMPNIPTLIRTISNILKKEYNQVKIATRNIKTTKSLLRPIKDPVPPNDQHNIVYSTPCNNCEGVYIGMTTNQLKKRMSGHKSDVNKIVNTPTDITQAKTALTQHMIEHNHTFNLDGTKIVDRTLRSTALPILEMCHIQNTSNTINFRTDVDGLNTAYAGILHTIKTTNSRREQLRNSTHNTHY
ncbi:uncharacterized protein LOC134288363 [Aedes albopictus]|uniref:Reverse transcriptase domain-containing protein n=1 Tax=Aedes albopictus TaxID=7160 RepID=A0ABM1Z4H2_AEDAL